LKSRQKKWNQLPLKSSKKPTLGQNVRTKTPDIDRRKNDPISIIAVTTDIKDEEFYVLGVN
jgi:hypothetical protein